MKNSTQDTLLSFNTHNGKLVIDLNEIAYCEALGSYTLICNIDGRKNLISKNLKAMSNYLGNNDFIRVHSSHIVNRNIIRSYDKRNSQVTLTNDRIVPVSRRKASTLRWASHDVMQHLI